MHEVDDENTTTNVTDVIENNIENEANKVSLKGISVSTWVSTGLTIIAAINELLIVSGINTPLTQVSDHTWSLILTLLFLGSVRFYSWWHNNSVTKNAQKADKEILNKNK